MVDFFATLSKEKIKTIAYEIALLGVDGIRADKSGYKVKTIPDSDFNGSKLLAFYYASWALAIPEMFDQLGLPYEREYTLAQRLNKK